jgi:hypothetical protein
MQVYRATGAPGVRDARRGFDLGVSAKENLDD